jgi:hypothetical protein
MPGPLFCRRHALKRVQDAASASPSALTAPMRGAALLLAALLVACSPEQGPVGAVGVAPLPPTAPAAEPAQAVTMPRDIEMPPARPSAEAMAVAAQLPLRIGPWVRAAGPADEGAIARNGRPAPYIRYTMPGTGSWATVAVNGHDTPLPDGFASSALVAAFDANLATIRAAAPGDVARLRMVWIPDAPEQRCITGRAYASGIRTEHVACATAVAGQELRVRITASYRPGDSGRFFQLEGNMARLIADVTRAAAGRFSEVARRSDGRAFTPAFGPERAL